METNKLLLAFLCLDIGLYIEIHIRTSIHMVSGNLSYNLKLWDSV